MSRYGSDRVVRAAWWDPDEDATFSGKLSFLEIHRVTYYQARLTELGPPTTEDELLVQTKLMCRSLFTALKCWTLRDREPTYEEAEARRVKRKIVPLTIDGLIAQPMDDISFLYRSVFPELATPAPVSAVVALDAAAADLSDEQRAEMASTVITKAAAEEGGLTRATFPDQHPDPVDLPGRRRGGVVQRRGHA